MSPLDNNRMLIPDDDSFVTATLDEQLIRKPSSVRIKEGS